MCVVTGFVLRKPDSAFTTSMATYRRDQRSSWGCYPCTLLPALCLLLLLYDVDRSSASSSEGGKRRRGGPQQVHLEVTAKPTEMGVWWTTDRSTPASQVRYGKYEWEARTGQGKVATAFGRNVRHRERRDRYDSDYMHYVRLTGLTPGETVHYSVGHELTGWSKPKTFRARTADAVTETSHVKIAVFGDQVRYGEEGGGRGGGGGGATWICKGTSTEVLAVMCTSILSSIQTSVGPSVRALIYLSVSIVALYLSIHLSIHLPVWLSNLTWKGHHRHACPYSICWVVNILHDAVLMRCSRSLTRRRTSGIGSSQTTMMRIGFGCWATCAMPTKTWYDCSLCHLHLKRSHLYSMRMPSFLSVRFQMCILPSVTARVVHSTYLITRGWYSGSWGVWQGGNGTEFLEVNEQRSVQGRGGDGVGWEERREDVHVEFGRRSRETARDCKGRGSGGRRDGRSMVGVGFAEGHGKEWMTGPRGQGRGLAHAVRLCW